MPYPSDPELLASYDTTRPPGDFSAWVATDLTNDAGAMWYGGAFDGRYVYLNPAGVTATELARCAPAGDGGCAAASDWAEFNLRELGIAEPDAGYVQYFGVAFDGRYLHFAPYATTTVALRFDTTAPFAEAASWSKFDLATLHGGASSLSHAGAVFDGEWVYFVPGASAYVTRFHARQPAAPPRGPAFGSFF